IILTTTTIDVEETIKGQPAGTVELTTIGGQIGDLRLVVPGMPAFEAGEEAIVFVENVGAYKTIVWLSQGKFAVRNGQVMNTVSGLSFPNARQGHDSLRMGLEDFKREIRNRLN